MSREDRYKQLKENDPTFRSPMVRQEHTHYFYDSPDASRRLSLEWDTGRKIMLIYAHLVAAELEVEGDLNKLHLRFIIFRVILEGFQLHNLYPRFLKDEPHILKIQDARYVANLEHDGFLITDANVTSRLFDDETDKNTF